MCGLTFHHALLLLLNHPVGELGWVKMPYLCLCAVVLLESCFRKDRQYQNQCSRAEEVERKRARANWKESKVPLSSVSVRSRALLRLEAEGVAGGRVGEVEVG